MTHNITIEGGTSARLPTAGKYCDRDIVVTATGGDVVPEPTTISGINLHDRETDIPNTYIKGASVLSWDGWTLTDFIPFEDGKFYIAYSTSEIDPQYCSRFNANKGGAAPNRIAPCANKNRPAIITGHGGYFRFSGTDAQINALEIYEVINLNWEW